MFKWLINLKLKNKLILSFLTMLTVTVCTILIAINIVNKNKISGEIEQIRKEETQKVKDTLKDYIDIVHTAIINEKLERAALGEMPQEQARKEIISEIEKLRYDEGTGYIWINDTTRPFPVMIMHPTVPALNGTILNDPKYNCAYSDKKMNLFQAFLEVCTKDREGYVDYLWPKPTPQGLTEEVPKISYVRLIPELNWIIGTGVYVDDIEKTVALKEEALLKENRELMVLILIIAAAVMVVMSVITMIYSNIITGPIERVRDVMDRISRGDLTVTINVKRKDEFGEVTEHFNQLLNDFRDNLSKTQITTDVLKQAIEDLTVSSREVSATSNQQSAAVKEIVSTMEDSGDLSRIIATKINEVSRISEQTRETVNRGFTLIQDNLSKMEEIKKSNQTMIEGIRSLVERIEGIWDIVNIINGIADQTKIIAFNAELEASAAGEAGKNFLIVASEVRRLADNTVSSTTEIRQKINEIQRSSDSLVITSEEGTERISEGHSISQKQQGLFQEILDSAEISATSAKQIVSSVDQQVTAFDQILQTLKQISRGIDGFVDSTRSTTMAADNLDQILSDFTVMLQKYNIGDETGQAALPDNTGTASPDIE